MVNFISKISFVSYFSFLIFLSWGKLMLKNLKTYKNDPSTYTTYEPWNLRGELSFVFRTSQTNVFLAYQDDGQHHFIEIFLYDGDIRFKSTLGDCAVEEVYVKGDFSDLHWHRVRVIIKPDNFSISVDDATTMLPCKPQVHGQNRGTGGNYLYVANFSPMTRGNLNLLAFPGTLYEISYLPSRFNGCLGDLWITDKGRLKLAEVIATKSTEIGCNSSCSTHTCQNQGKCIDEIGRVECDCLGTSYEGELCSEPSASMWFNASGYILYGVGTYEPGRSTLGNDIAFRFATSQPRGVIMFTDVADDHVIVELVDGFLRVSWDLGQGGLVLMSREGCLHDGAWHTVTIKRAKRRVKFTVDEQRSIFAAIPGKFSFLDFKGGKEMMYFGGGPLNNSFNRSLSRTNFTGFLQHLYFDEFKVINETLYGSKFKLVGEAVLNASSLFHLIATNPNPAEECSRKSTHNSEYLCEGTDDEDLCDMTTSGTGPDDVDCDSTDGDCSIPDVQEITGGPSVVNIPPVNASSSTSMESSRIHPSPSTTAHPGMTKYINNAANQTQIPSVKSTYPWNKFNISRNSFIIKPSSTVYRSSKQSVLQERQGNSDLLTNLTLYTVPHDSGLKPTLSTSGPTSIDINNSNNSALKPASSKAHTVNDSSLVKSKYSASITIPYGSVNISAVKSEARKVARVQASVFCILIISLLLSM